MLPPHSRLLGRGLGVGREAAGRIVRAAGRAAQVGRCAVVEPAAGSVEWTDRWSVQR